MSILDLFIVLKASNGKYVGQISENNHRLEARSEHIEELCTLRVYPAGNQNTYTFLANNAKYLECDNIKNVFATGSTQESTATTFRLYETPENGVIQIQNQLTGKNEYLMVENDIITMTNDSLHPATKFTLIQTIVAREKYNKAS